MEPVSKPKYHQNLGEDEIEERLSKQSIDEKMYQRMH